MFTVGSLDRSFGRYSGRHSVEIAFDSRSRLGRQSVDTRSRHDRQVVPDVSRSIQLFVHRYFTDTSPIVGRYLTDVSVGNWSTLGRWSVDTWSIVRRQPFDISVEIFVGLYSFQSVTNSPGEEIGAKLLKYEPILAGRVI